MLLLKGDSQRLKKSAFLERKRGRKGGNKDLEMEERRRTGETGRRRHGKSKTRIEKEMKKRLFWGAVGCETGPFTPD